MLLLSIQPSYVDKIFRGEKQVELRRRRPRTRPGDWIAVYSTTPQRMLVGLIQVEELRVDRPDRLWRGVKEIAGISRSDFVAYFEGTEQAVGIMIRKTILLPTPVSLVQLREKWPGFQPPQCFRYLSTEQVEFVVKRVGRRQLAT